MLQGYDSVAIEADLELGGTDQKFNLLFGRDVQESFGQRPQLILTMPILPGTDGVRRMSKSTGNYVGVTEEPAEMFGKLMSVPDEAMGLYWSLLLGEELDASAHPGKAKREMARRLVDRFHGTGAGERAEARFDEVHVRREIPADVPVYELTSGDGEPVHLPALIAGAFGTSASEARRLIAQGAVRIDGEPLARDELDAARRPPGGPGSAGRQAPLRAPRSPLPEPAPRDFGNSARHSPAGSLYCAVALRGVRVRLPRKHRRAEPDGL